MFKQSVSLVEFEELYNILDEIKDLFTFEILNYQNTSDFTKQIDLNNLKCINTLIVIKKNNHLLESNSKIPNNNIILVNELPLKIEKILEIINIQLIKHRYNFQSKLIIKDYSLNLNSRMISNKEKKLKLTEREIDIILFLMDQNKPQSINELQNKVWGYVLDLETHTVETHIYRLRKKIKDTFNNDNFILSLDDGYKI